MIYPTDFTYNYNFNKPNSNVKKPNNYSVSISHIPDSGFKDNSRKIYPTTPLESDESIWKRYCNNSTVHGFRYLTDPKIQCTER